MDDVYFVYKHYRNTQVVSPDGETINKQVDPRGGATLCIAKDKETREAVAYGIAVCSKEDNYVKERGRVKSRGRAVQAMTHGVFGVSTLAKLPAEMIEDIAEIRNGRSK